MGKVGEVEEVGKVGEVAMRYGRGVEAAVETIERSWKQTCDNGSLLTHLS